MALVLQRHVIGELAGAGQQGVVFEAAHSLAAAKTGRLAGACVGRCRQEKAPRMKAAQQCR
jgi:hypothetical protein